jgi:hypothetical protein
VSLAARAGLERFVAELLQLLKVISTLITFVNVHWHFPISSVSVLSAPIILRSLMSDKGGALASVSRLALPPASPHYREVKRQTKMDVSLGEIGQRLLDLGGHV